MWARERQRRLAKWSERRTAIPYPLTLALPTSVPATPAHATNAYPHRPHCNSFVGMNRRRASQKVRETEKREKACCPSVRSFLSFALQGLRSTSACHTVVVVVCGRLLRFPLGGELDSTLSPSFFSVLVLSLSLGRWGRARLFAQFSLSAALEHTSVSRSRRNRISVCHLGPRFPHSSSCALRVRDN